MRQYVYDEICGVTLRQSLFNKTNTNTILGLQKIDEYAIMNYSGYIMNLKHVGRPPLK